MEDGEKCAKVQKLCVCLGFLAIMAVTILHLDFFTGNSVQWYNLL